MMPGQTTFRLKITANSAANLTSLSVANLGQTAVDIDFAGSGQPNDLTAYIAANSERVRILDLAKSMSIIGVTVELLRATDDPNPVEAGEGEEA